MRNNFTTRLRSVHRVLSQQFRRQCVPLSGGSGRCRATHRATRKRPSRFAALAASILGNPVRRKGPMSHSIRVSAVAGVCRLATGTPSAGEGSTNSRVLGRGAEVSQLSVDAAPPGAPGRDALAEPLPDVSMAVPLIWAGFAIAFSAAGLLLPVAGRAGPLEPDALGGGRGCGQACCLRRRSGWGVPGTGRCGGQFVAAGNHQMARRLDLHWAATTAARHGVDFQTASMELTRSAASFVTATNPVATTGSPSGGLLAGLRSQPMV